jgi:hypothetical protein
LISIDRRFFEECNTHCLTKVSILERGPEILPRVGVVYAKGFVASCKASGNAEGSHEPTNWKAWFSLSPVGFLVLHGEDKRHIRERFTTGRAKPHVEIGPMALTWVSLCSVRI